MDLFVCLFVFEIKWILFLDNLYDMFSSLKNNASPPSKSSPKLMKCSSGVNPICLNSGIYCEDEKQQQVMMVGNPKL